MKDFFKFCAVIFWILGLLALGLCFISSPGNWGYRPKELLATDYDVTYTILKIALVLTVLAFIIPKGKTTSESPNKKVGDDIYYNPKQQDSFPNLPNWKEERRQENMSTDSNYDKQSWFGGAYRDTPYGKEFKGGSDAGRPWWW